jgi:peptidoglycan/LPS O-acetylase OafA/YrhL
VTVALAFLADLILVIVFVLIGRGSHDEDPIGGALVTLWPFAVGLVVGWLGARAWRSPRVIAPTGLVVWSATVIVGMVLRVASDQGVQLSFVIVASVVLGVFLLGWRLIAKLVNKRRSAPRS